MKRIIYIAFLMLCCLVSATSAQERMYNNPILPGFYPDPSICRVGDNFYLVNSSFEYFPGVPISMSKDLVHWKQIGSVLTRPSQIALDSVKYGISGVYAPSIRYHDGLFYMTTTMIGSKNPKRAGHFIVTAKNPAGPWSEPYMLDNTSGIDPCLFFDDNGKAYFIATRFANKSEEKYWKHSIIWMQELNLTTMKLVGDEKVILSQGGALHNARNAEGPRMLKHNGYYYLIIAEGGTGDDHAVTAFRSKNIEGPYETDPRNPILTNRCMGRDYPIQCIGHADMVDTPAGDWWMVALGVRPYANGCYNLARETFLVPMRWEGDWPVGAPAEGHVCMQHVAPHLAECYDATDDSWDSFDKTQLAPYWTFIRIPSKDCYSLTRRKGFLSLRLQPQTVKEELSPSFVGRRQQHINFVSETWMEFIPKKEKETAGLVMFQSPKCHYRLEMMLVNGEQYVVLTKCDKGVETVIDKTGYNAKRIGLKISAFGAQYNFYYSADGKEWHQIGGPQDGKILNSRYSGGFTGSFIGMYASSNGGKSSNYADFDSFSYREAFGAEQK